MERVNLLRSSTFRLSLTYLAIFALSALSLLGFVYFTTSAFMERQIQQTISAEIQGLAEQYRERGLSGLIEIIRERAARDRDRRSIYLLADGEFRPLTGNLSGWPQGDADEEGWVWFPIETLGERGTTMAHVAVARAFRLPGNFHLLVGRSTRDVEQVKEGIAGAMGWGLALTALLGAIGGFVMSRQLLHRVEAINKTIRRIMGGDMSQRMGVTGSNDEFDDLSASLNAMLDQIGRLVEGMRTVTDNIAHDLRTPLNRMRSRIEVALMGEPDAPTCRGVLEQTLADADHLLTTFNALLTIAQAEAGARVNQFAPVDLAELAAGVVELYEPVAEEKGLVISLAAQPASVEGDRHLLSQALANLLDNAVKYTPEGGRITVTVGATEGGGAELAVADNGPGIPEEARARVLERFVRLDETRSTPGNGLGLSLVDAVARLHDARLLLDDNHPGLVVRMVFNSGTPY